MATGCWLPSTAEACPEARAHDVTPKPGAEPTRWPRLRQISVYAVEAGTHETVDGAGGGIPRTGRSGPTVHPMPNPTSPDALDVLRTARRAPLGTLGDRARIHLGTRTGPNRWHLAAACRAMPGTSLHPADISGRRLSYGDNGQRLHLLRPGLVLNPGAHQPRPLPLLRPEATATNPPVPAGCAAISSPHPGRTPGWCCPSCTVHRGSRHDLDLLHAADHPTHHGGVDRAGRDRLT